MTCRQHMWMWTTSRNIAASSSNQPPHLLTSLVLLQLIYPSVVDLADPTPKKQDMHVAADASSDLFWRVQLKTREQQQQASLLMLRGAVQYSLAVLASAAECRPADQLYRSRTPHLAKWSPSLAAGSCHEPTSLHTSPVSETPHQ